MAVTIVPANQKAPAHYLNRRFAINFNLPKMGKLVKSTESFPALSQESALALAALSLCRLELALTGQAQANDGQVAGSVAAWATELAAARAQAVDALAAVRAAFPRFRTAVQVHNSLFAKECTAKGKTAYGAPSQLAANWYQ